MQASVLTYWYCIHNCCQWSGTSVIATTDWELKHDAITGSIVIQESILKELEREKPLGGSKVFAVADHALISAVNDDCVIDYNFAWDIIGSVPF